MAVNFAGEGQEQATKRTKLLGSSVASDPDETSNPAPRKSSVFKGVSYAQRQKKWRAEIQINGKCAKLGYFPDEESAARKYDEAAQSIGKPLNFPGPGQAPRSTMSLRCECC